MVLTSRRCTTVCRAGMRGSENMRGTSFTSQRYRLPLRLDVSLKETVLVTAS